MKLLLDENLSRRLVDPLSAIFEEVQHVVLCGLMHLDDQTIWHYAGRQGLIVVTKDGDFADLSLLRGHPPKVIWLKSGNGPRRDIARR